jgi:hypothetical protein
MAISATVDYLPGMHTEPKHPQLIHDTPPHMPHWVISVRVETSEDAAFLSGAALGHLHLVLAHAEVPLALLRERLALQAAETFVGFSGRIERAGALRDAVHLLRPGDLPGPAGESYQCWRRVVERPVAIKALHRALPQTDPAMLARWLDTGLQDGTRGPVSRASAVLETVLTEAPRAEALALILADAALAQSLGWTHVVPLFAIGLKRGDLHKRGNDLRLGCHRAVTVAAVETTRLAADLARRAAHLAAVAPKLRAKGAGQAVEMFLTRDAIAPSALSLPDRAARRLCDRLVDLGAVRELTGRDTF